MNPMQRNVMPNQPVNPQPPEPKYRFRWGIFVGIPLVTLFFFAVLRRIEPSYQFEDIVRYLDVIYEYKYARLVSLGIVIIAVTLIVKSLRNHPE
jgi:hypothetical protein